MRDNHKFGALDAQNIELRLVLWTSNATILYSILFKYLQRSTSFAFKIPKPASEMLPFEFCYTFRLDLLPQLLIGWSIRCFSFIRLIQSFIFVGRPIGWCAKRSVNRFAHWRIWCSTSCYPHWWSVCLFFRTNVLLGRRLTTHWISTWRVIACIRSTIKQDLCGVRRYAFVFLLV